MIARGKKVRTRSRALINRCFFISTSSVLLGTFASLMLDVFAANAVSLTDMPEPPAKMDL